MYLFGSGFVACLLYASGFKIISVSFLAALIITSLINTKWMSGDVAVSKYSPLIFSMTQLMGISLVYFLEISPIALGLNRYELFTDDAVLLVLFCNMLQTLAAIKIAHSKVDGISMGGPVSFKIFPILLITVIASWGANSDVNTFIVMSYSESLASRDSRAWGGWPLLYILTTSYVLLKLSVMTYRLRILSISIVILEVVYFLLHGNRSEILIVLLFIAIKYTTHKSSAGVNFWKTKTISLLTIIGIIFYTIGEIRSGDISGIGIFRGDFLHLSTVSGSLWSQIATVSLYSPFGTQFGETYIYYIKNFLPSFIPVPWDKGEPITSFLDNASIVGGLGFWGEAYINFGIFGVLSFTMLFSIFYRWILKKSVQHVMFSILLLSITLYIPRLYYYDIIYLVKLLFAFSLLLLAYKVLIIRRRKL